MLQRHNSRFGKRRRLRSSWCPLFHQNLPVDLLRAGFVSLAWLTSTISNPGFTPVSPARTWLLTVGANCESCSNVRLLQIVPGSVTFRSSGSSSGTAGAYISSTSLHPSNSSSSGIFLERCFSCDCLVGLGGWFRSGSLGLCGLLHS